MYFLKVSYGSWYSVSETVLYLLGFSIAALVIALVVMIFVLIRKNKELIKSARDYRSLETQSNKKYLTLAIRYNEAINKYSHIVYSYLANNIEDETEAIAKLNEAVKGDYEWLETKRVFSKKDRKIMEAAIELTDSQKENILNLMQSMSEK